MDGTHWQRPGFTRTLHLSPHRHNGVVFREVPGVPSAIPLAKTITSAVSAALVGVPGQATATDSFIYTDSEASPTTIQATKKGPVTQSLKAAATVKGVSEETTTQAQQPAAKTIIATSATRSSSHQITKDYNQGTVIGANQYQWTGSNSLYSTLQSSTTMSSRIHSSISPVSAHSDLAWPSLSTPATSAIPPSGRLEAGTNEASLGHMSVPRPTATATPSTTRHEALPPGTKAAIGLGALVFVLMVAILAILFWRRRRHPRDSPPSSSGLPELQSGASRRASPLGKLHTSDKELSRVEEEQHLATIWENKQRCEMRLATTPKYNSWAPALTSVRPAELDGGWSPSEIGGRPSKVRMSIGKKEVL